MNTTIKKSNFVSSKSDLSARERLIVSASSVFSQNGFGGSSVREICELAGTSSNMIHHYFGSKRGLYDEILSRFSEHVFIVPIRIISEPPGTRENLVARLEIFMEETLEALIEHSDMYRLAVRELVVFAALESYQQQLVRFLESGKEANIVRADLDTEMLTGLILDRLGNQILYAPWIMETSGLNIETNTQYKKRWLKANLDLILNGMLNQ